MGPVHVELDNGIKSINDIRRQGTELPWHPWHPQGVPSLWRPGKAPDNHPVPRSLMNNWNPPICGIKPKAGVCGKAERYSRRPNVPEVRDPVCQVRRIPWERKHGERPLVSGTASISGNFLPLHQKTAHTSFKWYPHHYPGPLWTRDGLRNSAPSPECYLIVTLITTVITGLSFRNARCSDSTQHCEDDISMFCILNIKNQLGSPSEQRVPC